jgi:DNA-binding response OmpR family regulator
VSGETVAGELAIVLLDDHDDVRETLAILFRIDGYRCSTATTTRQALGLIARERPCLVIFEPMLAHEDTREFAREVREVANPGVHIVALSKVERDDLPAFAHVDHWFTKPSSLRAAVARLRPTFS